MLNETVWNERQPRPFDEKNMDETYVYPQYRVDLRRYSEKEYNKFVKLNTVSDCSLLSWKDVFCTWVQRSKLHRFITFSCS